MRTKAGKSRTVSTVRKLKGWKRDEIKYITTGRTTYLPEPNEWKNCADYPGRHTKKWWKVLLLVLLISLPVFYLHVAVRYESYPYGKQYCVFYRRNSMSYLPFLCVGKL